MLIRFSVENYLSFRTMQTLDLSAVASCKERRNDNVFTEQRKALLKSAVIYGANASGKSNVIHAFKFFRDFIISSAKDYTSGDDIGVIPFLLNVKTRQEPSKFEMEFICGENKYFYGFHAAKKQIVKEWLYENKKPVFFREADGDDDVIQTEDTWRLARGLEERTRKNSLFLSVCAQFAVPKAVSILDWIQKKTAVLSGMDTDSYKLYTRRVFQNEEYRQYIQNFIRNADTQIQRVEVKDPSALLWKVKDVKEETSKGIREKLSGILDDFFSKGDAVKSIHNVYDEQGNVQETISFPLEERESAGTNKIYALSGPVIDVLKNGKLLFVDELDSQLHPLLTRQIVRLFNSKEMNPNNAQLIFNSHDTNLLSQKVGDSFLFRRDQVYFTEKDQMEATRLYSLVDFKRENGKSVRNDASFEKDYMNGVYGAIPFVDDLLNQTENDGEIGKTVRKK